jgi:hypothetical protein
LAFNLVKLADFPAKQVESDYIMQMGNEIQIADGELMIAMTPAVHSSSVFNPKAGPNEPGECDEQRAAQIRHLGDAPNCDGLGRAKQPRRARQ